MRVAARLSSVVFVSLLLSSQVALAEDDCKCLAIAGDVTGAIQVQVAKADSLYVRGDLDAALGLYASAYEKSKVSVLLYAQAMTKWRLGATDDARALFDAYIKAGGNLAYRAQAEVSLKGLGGKVGGVVDGGLGLTDRVTGEVGVDGVTRPVTGTVGGVSAEVTGRLDGNVKPPKVAKGAAIVLGVVAFAAVGAVGIHSIAAGLKDDIELDAKFDLGLGLTGLTVGITAIYLYGLTAAAGTAGSLKCETRPRYKPLVAPIALPGGGGLATAMTF
ncbi:MAG: hypothetical protein H0T42_18330 [Deltaproteobacteria bacterium]|nr:hypothetical protein [Deltaproteobacteria bacterium]